MSKELHQKANAKKKPAVRVRGGAQVAKNLRKLERGSASKKRGVRKPATNTVFTRDRMMRLKGYKPDVVKSWDDLSAKKKIKAIWKMEGIDAAVHQAEGLGVTKTSVLRWITKWLEKEDKAG